MRKFCILHPAPSYLSIGFVPLLLKSYSSFMCLYVSYIVTIAYLLVLFYSKDNTP